MRYTIMDVFVYILQCSDSSLYTGITAHLANRMKQHSSGRGSKYVRSRRPFRLVYLESLENRADAMRREREIKRMPRMKKEILVQKQSTCTRNVLESLNLMELLQPWEQQI